MMINYQKFKSSPQASRAKQPESVRSRAGSTPGLDNNQINAILNKKHTSSFATLFCKSSDNVEPDESSTPPTRSMSVISVTSVLSPSSIDAITKDDTTPRFVNVIPSKDTSSESSSESALEVTPRKKPEEEKKIEERKINPRVLYINEIVWKIDDVVYAAGFDAATNMSLLCRLNIEFVCEISDESQEILQQTRRSNRGFDCPCLCPRQLNHFRYFVSMDVPETEQKCIESKINMHNLFNQFNELVERGRKAGKSVLVCSTRGRNRAPAFCAAYLMNRERLSRGKAVAKVYRQMHTMRPPVNISDFMQRALMRYQAAVGVEPEAAYDSSHSIQLFHVKRSAWT